MKLQLDVYLLEDGDFCAMDGSKILYLRLNSELLIDKKFFDKHKKIAINYMNKINNVVNQMSDTSIFVETYGVTNLNKKSTVLDVLAMIKETGNTGQELH